MGSLLSDRPHDETRFKLTFLLIIIDTKSQLTLLFKIIHTFIYDNEHFNEK